MHVGNLRTALYAYLIAKHEGGDFILRIEDTDQERYVEGAVDIINRTLEETGLVHDEGPDKDGGCGPYVQSERVHRVSIMKYAKELIDKGEHITVSVTRSVLTVLKQLLQERKFFMISIACICQRRRLKQISRQGVVRGNEYLSSSPKYNRLYEAFGWDVPVYVHCPLITDEEHHKLSKRCGHSSFEDLLDQGFLTEAIVNFVALLGWSPSDNQEIMSLPELVEKFDYHHMSKSPAVFDFTKLKWMNGEYIKKLDFDKFYEMALPYIKEVVTKDYDLKKIARMVQTRIEIFPDIKEHIDFFEELPDYDIAMYTHKKMKTNPETSLEVLNDVVPILESCDDFSNDALFETLKAYATEKGYKIGYVMWPIRTAVSGKQMTPGGATELMEVFGKEESIARIKKGIEKLSNN